MCHFFAISYQLSCLKNAPLFLGKRWHLFLNKKFDNLYLIVYFLIHEHIFSLTDFFQKDRRFMKKILFIILISTCLVTHGCTESSTARVVKVVDGDTLHVLLNGKREKIRLYGIDAPENNQPYGAQATAYLSKLQGHTVDIQVLDTDRYKRLVALVSVDGVFVQSDLIAHGFSWVYPRHCKQVICHEWREQEQRARAQREGLWRGENPIPPWQWRRR